MSTQKTQVLENPLKMRLQSGGLGLALMIRHARTVDIGLAARACGFDAIYFDMQHSPLPENDVSQMCVTALGAGVTPIVRVPDRDYGLALRMLDSGALGIVMPDCASAADARAAAHLGDTQEIIAALPSDDLETMDVGPSPSRKQVSASGVRPPSSNQWIASTGVTPEARMLIAMPETIWLPPSVIEA